MLRKKFISTLVIIVLVSATASGCGMNMDKKSNSTADKSNVCGTNNSCNMAANTTSKMTSSTDTAVDEIQDTSDEITLDGWLFDYMSRGSKTPDSKTKKCLLMDKMRKSGYGVLVKDKDNSYKFYKFDDNGQKLAKSSILDKTKKSKNITIEVKGTVKNKILQVSYIIEK